MTTADIVTMITTVGFPIVCCIAMGWYVKYVTDEQREEIKNLTEKHREEMTEVTTAINNNTIALTKLCDKLDGQGVS